MTDPEAPKPPGMTKRLYMTVMSLSAVIVLFVTFYLLPEFSVLGFVLIALFALELACDRFEHYFMSGIDTDVELEKDNRSVAIVTAARYIAYAIVIGAALMAVPKAAGAEPPHITEAKKYVGLVEKPGNRGSLIDSWNREAGAALGSPYCASFTGHCLNVGKAATPVYRGAYSRAYVTKASLVLPLKSYDIDLTGYLLIFKRKGGGHIGPIEYNRRHILFTIEANTSPQGFTGSQYDGGGVFKRIRNLKVISSPYNVFRATHVTPVAYAPGGT